MHSPRPTSCRRSWACALMLVCAMAASAKDPPLDPWNDGQWRSALTGLRAGEVRSVRWSEQVFDAGGEPAPASAQSRRFEFSEDGRLAAFGSERSRRGERDERRQLRYQWGAQGQLQRIDEEGAEPVLRRQSDSAGRP